jgi:hypothetical protein
MVRAALTTLNHTIAVGVVSGAAHQLSQEVFKLMVFQRLRVRAATVVAGGLIAWGASVALVRLSEELSEKLVATPIAGAD